MCASKQSGLIQVFIFHWNSCCSHPGGVIGNRTLQGQVVSSQKDLEKIYVVAVAGFLVDPLNPCHVGMSKKKTGTHQILCKSHAKMYTLCKTDASNLSSCATILRVHCQNKPHVYFARS